MQLLHLLLAALPGPPPDWKNVCAGLWTSEESVGNAGATNLGYYGGVFSPDGTAIQAHGFTGALHLWRSAGQQGSPSCIDGASHDDKQSGATAAGHHLCCLH